MYATSKIYEKAYLAGKSAYFDGHNKDACPHDEKQDDQRSFWLAGWMDADIETVGLDHFRKE